MAPKHLLKIVNPITFIKKGIGRLKRITPGTKWGKKAPPDLEDYDVEDETEWADKTYPQYLEIIIDGKSYRLVREKKWRISMST